MNHTTDDDGGRSIRLNRLNDDVLQVLCSTVYEASREDRVRWSGRVKHTLMPLSLTCKKFRALCVQYLFRTFKLVFAYNTTWEEAATKLQTWNEGWSRFVHEINIHMISGSKVSRDAFVEELPGALAHVLVEISRASPYVETISIQIHEDRIHSFEEAFKTHGLQFSTVRSLTVRPNSDGIVALGPNVTTLAIVHAHSCPRILEWLISALAGLPRLKRLSLDGTPYTCDMINTIFAVNPDLVALRLPASLSARSNFEEFAHAISRFSKLEVLCIPAAAKLWLGCTVPLCSRGATDHAAVRERYDEYARTKKEVEQHAAMTFFSSCPKLKELYVGTRIRANLYPILDEKLRWRKVPEFVLC